ncbi:glutamine-hydrolyzing GMP synthase [Treponema sp. Marseille-Q3903]|uniref:glutamine-hydrolyzing GMP synthase n=1 Tax=Treponema sp. Marseille-Q3903 TaxID=2766703 RepID=UPI0016521FDE|nr:glutamine-hydrolyzing GMP synthase [Treponema sp. Marseille-Q3903]MBC6713106.1 glutamine-hydrolyzing GMP synthase [Treponema sp. Marseille-Q3903]
MSRSKIVVLDFGSQYAHLIAKRFRMLGYYSEIALPSTDIFVFENCKGIVFSGGPSSVYDEKVPEFNSEILNLDIPILGLCYGHYIVQLGYNGKVGKQETGEFGFATLNINEKLKSPLFEGIEHQQQVWMSHQDGVLKLGDGFEVLGSTKDCKYAATQNLAKKRFSLQFHCEVKDTPCGERIFQNFANYCGMEKNWDHETVLQIILENIKKDAGDKNVLLFLSGGVDSTITFALLNKALGQKRVLGLHIDNGFMRKNESAEVAAAYKKFGFSNFITEDASESFLKAIAGLTDPQKKRMAVGENFITVYNEVISKQKLDDNWLLAQGTLYPDIIESGGTKNSNTIKTHHNRVDGIQKLIEKGLIIEPIRELYKDEVRAIGYKLGLPEQLIMRHPFPGPGLSINVLCYDGKSWSQKDEEEYAAAKKELAEVTLDMFCANCTANLKRDVLPVRSVGVQGDFRTYRFPAILDFGSAKDGEWANRTDAAKIGMRHFPNKREKIEACSSAITNKARFINRTCIKLYQKQGVKNEDLKLQEGYCDRRRLDQLREVDNIVLTELRKAGWYDKIFQHLTIGLPFATSADRATFVLRPVVSEDVMTARFAMIPKEILGKIVEQIAALPFVDALYFDATNKPPATFGWE